MVQYINTVMSGASATLVVVERGCEGNVDGCACGRGPVSWLALNIPMVPCACASASASARLRAGAGAGAGAGSGAGVRVRVRVLGGEFSTSTPSCLVRARVHGETVLP